MTKKMPTMAGAMTPFPHSIDCDLPLRDAKAMMAEHGIHHLPVTRDGDLFGIISATDVLVAGNLDPALGETIRAVCTADPYVVDIHSSLADVSTAMAQRHIGSALVVRQGKLVGILTHTDVCRELGEALRALYPPSDDDTAA